MRVFIRFSSLLCSFALTSADANLVIARARAESGNMAPPLCYIDAVDGSRIDLTSFCGQSNSGPPPRVVEASGTQFLPLRAPEQSDRCTCPYDTNSTGQVCDNKSVFAEGSPTCYRPRTSN